MSDNKRSKKYHNLKESKRTIILAKKDDSYEDRTTSSHTDQPKILLKAKDKPVPTVAPQPPPQISIATRETSDQSRISSPVPSKSATPATASNASANIINKDCKELLAPVIIEQPVVQIPQMQKCLPLITDHYQLNTQPFDYLIETNSNFFVVGVLGPQGTGKSTLLNILCANDSNPDSFDNPEKYYFRDKEGVFPTKRTKEQIFSPVPTTEGIQMYITKERTILLDCSPVLCNPYKKDYMMNQIDDLKMVIFLMSVCHLLIVVQEDMINGSLFRVLHCSETMKPNFDKEFVGGGSSTISGSQQHLQEEFFPNVLFVKNMAEASDFLPTAYERYNRFYKQFFGDSKLRIFSGSNHQPAMKNDDDAADCTGGGGGGVGVGVGGGGNKKPSVQRNLNLFMFPKIHNTPTSYTGHPKIHLLMAQFRQRVFMSPRKQFQTMPPQTMFLEKNWSHLVVNAWESHKNNYFLRKLENFKERELTTRNSVQ